MTICSLSLPLPTWCKNCGYDVAFAVFLISVCRCSESISCLFLGFTIMLWEKCDFESFSCPYLTMEWFQKNLEGTDQRRDETIMSCRENLLTLHFMRDVDVFWKRICWSQRCSGGSHQWFLSTSLMTLFPTVNDYIHLLYKVCDNDYWVESSF